MPNEFLTRSEEVVDGTYRLGAVVSRSVRAVVYETEAGDGAGPAVIKIRELEGSEPEQQAERWREAMRFSHPNLLRVYGAGSSVLNDAPVAYVVMERAEESLAGVLAERRLSEEETTEMLGPTLSALAYLHKNGYAHGSVKASNVMAAGDKLKLSSDSAVRVAEGGSTAEDMRAVGLLVSEALPEPRSPLFADIIKHCLEADPEQRWTVEQVEKRLYAPSPRLQVVPPAPIVERVEPRRAEEEKVPARGTPKWIFAGLAAVILIVALVAALRHFGAGSTPQAAATPVAVAADDSASSSAGTLPSVNTPVVPAPVPVQSPPPGVTGRKAGGWATIVAAYGSRAAAEKRLHSLERKWTKFNFTVQEQGAEKARYLVVLGRGLSENDAEALRKRAVNAGLPRDAYIKKLM